MYIFIDFNLIMIFTTEGGPSYFDFRYKDHVYKVIHEKYLGYRADYHCSTLGINSSLAAFESEDEKVRYANIFSYSN